MEEIVEGCLMIMMIMVMMMMSRRRRRRRMSMVCGALSRFLRRRLSLSVVSLSQTMMLVSSWWSSLSSSSSSSSSSSLLSSPSSLWLWKKEIMRLHQNCMEQIQSILIWVTLCRSCGIRILWNKCLCSLGTSLGEMPYADAGQGRLMLRSNERNTNTKTENFELLLLLQLWDCCWSAVLLEVVLGGGWNGLGGGCETMIDSHSQAHLAALLPHPGKPETMQLLLQIARHTAHTGKCTQCTQHICTLHTVQTTRNHRQCIAEHARAWRMEPFWSQEQTGKCPFMPAQCPVATSTPDLGYTLNCSLISFHAAKCIQVD